MSSTPHETAQESLNEFNTQGTAPIQSDLQFILIANSKTVSESVARLREHYNMLAASMRIKGESRLAQVPESLRNIKMRDIKVICD